jgi:hypothetical protein
MKPSDRRARPCIDGNRQELGRRMTILSL